MQAQATTGLTVTQLNELITLVENHILWEKGQGRPKKLSLRDALRITLTYFHTNLTERALGEFFNVDQSTVSRAVSILEPVIAHVLEGDVPRLEEYAQGRVSVVDGSLCPCWSWADSPELYSGKHKKTGNSHLFISDTEGTIIHISDPLPGNTHDAQAFHQLGLSKILNENNAIGDKGFLGTGLLTPLRTPPGGDLHTCHKEFNTAINKIRSAIERGIAHFKTWRCMHTDYRRPLRTYINAFRAVRALYFFKQSFA